MKNLNYVVPINPLTDRRPKIDVELGPLIMFQMKNIFLADFSTDSGKFKISHFPMS